MWEIQRLEGTGPPKFFFDPEFLYSLVHLLLVFFIPAVIVFVSARLIIKMYGQVCYVVVLSWVWVNSRPVLSNVRQCGSFDTADTIVTRNTSKNRRMLPPRSFHSHAFSTSWLILE